MRYLKIAGLALASMLLVSMALAGSAAAKPLWLLCLEGSNSKNTKYEDSGCLHTNAGGPWESVGIGTKSDTVRLAGVIMLLLDHKATGGSSGVRCTNITNLGSGLITGPNRLIIRGLSVPNPKTECERVEGGCKAGEVESVEWVDLPWKNELFETEKAIAAALEEEGKGQPGYKVTCNTLLGKVTDECKSVSGAPEILTWKNMVTEGVELLVFVIFLGRREWTCTQGGANSGLILGSLAVLLEEGNGLSVNPE